MMREKAHLTLKEKRKCEDGSGAPAYETLVFTIKRKGQSRKKERYLDI